MAFVSSYEHDIFVSYAPVDDRPHPGVDEGWVTTFIKSLKIELDQRLGCVNACSVWEKYHVPGNFHITPEITNVLHHSATLLVILSEGYLRSEWCQKEQNRFLHIIADRSRAGSRIFVIERSRIEPEERLPEFRDLPGYRFWVEDREGRPPRILGDPKPQAEDRRYYELINDLSYDLSKELKALRKTCVDKEISPEADIPATVFLADVTDDLYFVREDVKRYLTQSNLRVLPKTWYSYDPKAFQHAAREDLAKSDLFVQLLSDVPGKKPPDLPQGYVRCQYVLAQEMGKTILQWRSPELNLDAVHDPEHREFLQNEAVIAVGIEEFKAEIVKQVFPQKARKIPFKKNDPLVVVQSDVDDVDLADDICHILRHKFHVSYFNPRPSAANSRIIEKFIQRCDGVMIIYGNVDTDWVAEQYLGIRDVVPKRGQPLAAIAIYDGPPEDKPELPFDSPEMHIIKCRDCLKEEEIREFINTLYSGGMS